MRTLATLLACALFAGAEPRRIVSTAPSITEMLYALGLGDRVQGVTVYCHYPPEATKKPKIGSYLRPDVETILSLRPDLVVVQKNPSNLTDRLRGLKLPVLELDGESIGGIYTSIQALGSAAGVPDRAERLNTNLRQQLEQIRRGSAGSPKKRMMFVVGRTPGTLDGLVVVGKASYLSELMEAAGAVNVFKDSLAAYPKVSHEEVLARNPEVIVDMGDMADTVGVTEQQKQSVVALWNRYPTLAAVRDHRVFAVAADIFVVPGPRFIEAAAEFARMAGSRK